MMIDTVVFDMGGVLLDFSAELFSKRLNVGAEGRELLLRGLLRTADWVRLDRGTITEEEVYAHACARLPKELHAAADIRSATAASGSKPSNSVSSSKYPLMASIAAV